MTKHPDCADRCQLNEHKGYPPCDLTSGECAWWDRMSTSDRDALLAAIADSDAQAYGQAMAKRDQLAGPSGTMWEDFGGYGRLFQSGSDYLNPNNLARLREQSKGGK